MSSVGALTLSKTGLNYEGQRSYGLTAEVRDAKGLTTSALVTVQVTDANDAPANSSSTVSSCRRVRTPTPTPTWSC